MVLVVPCSMAVASPGPELGCPYLLASPLTSVTPASPTNNRRRPHPCSRCFPTPLMPFMLTLSHTIYATIHQQGANEDLTIHIPLPMQHRTCAENGTCRTVLPTWQTSDSTPFGVLFNDSGDVKGPGWHFQPTPDLIVTAAAQYGNALHQQTER